MAEFLEVARLFLKLGFTAFGGPAAHIAIMHDEVVKRRKWLQEEEFLDLLGATNLIPGPNSTEMAIHIGYRRAGGAGLIAAGLGFVLPATLIVLVISWLYVRLGATPQLGWLMSGIEPVILAIILQAVWMLGRRVFRDPLTILVGLYVFALQLMGINELALLFSGGLLVMLVRNRRALARPSPAILLPAAAMAQAAIPFSLPTLFLTFLKIGSILYGSGYVLIAFIRADFVERLGWLTDQQLIDAITIGQITPGPLFTAATFIGYLLAGTPGALLATLGIFLPSFLYVALSNPLIPRMRKSAWLGALLDGVNAASLGLMAAVTLQLAGSTLQDLPQLVLFAAAAMLLLKYKINTTWLIAGGGLAGFVLSLLG